MTLVTSIRSRKPFFRAFAVSLALHAFAFCILQFLPSARPSEESPPGPDALSLFLQAGDDAESGEGTRKTASPEHTPRASDVRPAPDRETSASGAAGNAAFRPLFDGLKNRLDSLKRYPEQAKKKNIQGVVIVLLTLDADGIVSASGIFQSSGHGILDDDALELVKKAAPFPHDLGCSVNLIIPISYRLTDPE